MRNLALLIAIFFISCRGISGQSPCEKKLKQGLNKNWKYDAEKKGYVSNRKFLTELDSLYKDCLYGKDTLYLSKLFGKDYELGQKGKNFIMEFPIISFAYNEGGAFSFILDEKYKVVKNYFVGVYGGDLVY